MDENRNPDKVLDAVIDTKPLTIAQMALLEKIESPILRGDLNDLNECLKALWITSVPVAEAAKKHANAYEEAMAWAADFSGIDYQKRIADLCDAIASFWKMLPAPDEDSKKKPDTTQTDGSQN